MQTKMIAFVCLLVFSSAATIQAQPPQTAEKFDPSRNARKDIADAITKAQQTHKRILLDVGGQWCVWCHRLDDYFAQNASLAQLREENFLWVKINFSPENENKELLATYPEIKGYPHLFVLDADGKLLHSQDTGLLEAGKSYDFEKMLAFLQKWSKPKRH
jgi:thiol:disulfide interchange protein